MKQTWVLGFVILFVLAGCGQSIATLPADQAAEFADEVAPITENLLTGLNDQDYTAYTRDMDEQMLAASSEAQFDGVYTSVIGKIGRYVSSEVVRVEEREQFRTVVYDAQFEQEEHVTVRVVYNVAGDQPMVSGLWFDSPKLRQQ